MPRQLIQYCRRAHVLRLPPRVLVWIAQVIIFGMSAFVAFLLRFDFDLPRLAWQQLQYALPFWLLAK